MIRAVCQHLATPLVLTVALLQTAACSRSAAAANTAVEPIATPRRIDVAAATAGDAGVAESRAAPVATSNSDLGSPSVSAEDQGGILLLPPQDIAMVLDLNAIHGLSLPHPESRREGKVWTALGAPRCQWLMGRVGEAVGMFRFDCSADPQGGLWALVGAMERRVKPNQFDWTSGHWTLVHAVDATMHRSDRQPFRCINECESDSASNLADCYTVQGCGGGVPPMMLAFRDLDGDGRSEALALGREEVNTGVFERSWSVWQDRGRKVEPHSISRTSAVFVIDDCNGDGRLEFFVNPYRVAGDQEGLTFGPSSRFSSPRWGLLAAEGGTTGYRFDSYVSRAFAEQICPRPVERPFSARAGDWPQRLHCAKLWGADEKALDQQLTQACKSPGSEDIGKFCKWNERIFRKMIQTKLPMSLRSPAPTDRAPAVCPVEYWTAASHFHQ
jgi:hypothetical protein